MDDHPTLSSNIPRIAPPRMHARKPSRSPTRNRLGDDLLADLSPATTLEAFTSPSGKLKASIEAATPSERAFGLRATLASKKIQEWVSELSDWPWPTEGGSVGFQVPAAKRRKLTNSSTISRVTHNGSERSAGQEDEEVPYVGSLPAAEVERYENRIDEITDEMDDLNVDDIKRQVLDTHFSPKSRPSSSASNAPPMPSLFASYTKMDDFTAVVTATVLQALPNLSRLMRLMDIWTIRLNVLRKIPPLLKALDDVEIALRSGWPTPQNSREGAYQNGMHSEEQIMSRVTFSALKEVLQRNVTNLGKDLDYILDALEGREDTLPDDWLDRMDIIEQDYGEWVVAGDRKVREGEWALMEKRRKQEELDRKMREAELARLEAEQMAIEMAKLKAMRDVEDAETARTKGIAEEVARIKADEEALEAARLEALRLEIAEAARITAERKSQEVAKRKVEEVMEMARLQALKEMEIDEIARIEAARIETERMAQELVRQKSADHALALLRLKTAEEAATMEATRIEAARLEQERKVQDEARRIAEEEEALELARREAFEAAELAKIEAVKIKAETEAKEVAQKKAAEELSRLRLLEELEAARVEIQRQAQISAQKHAEAKALEVIRIHALEEAEATRLRVEYETKVLAARKASEETLETTRSRDAKEAEATILQATQAAETLRKAELEAAASERLRIQNEVPEADRFNTLQEIQDVGALRLKLEGEARDLVGQRVQVEAAKNSKKRFELELDEADKTRLERKFPTPEQARVETQAKEVADVEAGRLMKGITIKTARPQAEGDAGAIHQQAKDKVEKLQLQEQMDLLSIACIQPENDALETERVVAQDADIFVRHKAEQDIINTAKQEAEPAAGLARPRAETEDQEIVRLQESSDAENTQLSGLWVDAHADTQRSQTEADDRDTLRGQGEQDTELARTDIQETTRTAKLQAVIDTESATDSMVEQDVETTRAQRGIKVSTLVRQRAQDTTDAQLQYQDELPGQQVEAHVSFTNEATESASNLIRDAPLKVQERSLFVDLSSHSPADTAEPNARVQFASVHALNPAAYVLHSPTGSNLLGDTTSTMTGALAAIASPNSSEEISNPTLSNHSHVANIQDCRSSDPDGEAPSPTSDKHFPHMSKGSANDKLDMPQEIMVNSGFEMPIKLDAMEPHTPTLGSPIHFDDQFNARISPASNSSASFEDLQVKIPECSVGQTRALSTSLVNTSSPKTSLSPIVGSIRMSSQQQGATTSPRLPKSLTTRPNYDGAADAVGFETYSTVGTGWIAIDPPDDNIDQNPTAVTLSPESGLSDDVFRASRLEEAMSLPNEDNVDGTQSNYTNSASTLESLEPQLSESPRSPQTPIKFSGIEMSKNTVNTHADDGLFQSRTELEKVGSFSTPPKGFQSSHTDLEEDADLSSILSPVIEEDLMPSIEVDFLDGSCSACDSYVQGDEEVAIARNRNTSVGRFDNDMRGVPRSRRDSISSDTSTIINNRISEGPSSPNASPQQNGSFLNGFPEDADQSPSAGRVGHRNQKSYEFSLPPSPLAAPRLSKQRSLQVLRTPGYGFNDPAPPATPLEAPTFDNVGVTAAPMLASPRKPSNDEQLQQQISSLLETIPARIRLTSDVDSTPTTSQTIRPKKTRRSVTPSFRPSSSMSNYSTYSRAPTPSFTLAPAFSKTTQRSRGSVGNPEIKLYHLSRSTGEAPIKLFVRLVGESGERVMVRVGGGWADLGEYLKEYASHHGRRSTMEGGEKIEIQDLPSRVVSGSSITSNTTIRDNGRMTAFSRPSSVMGNRPGSSLEVRKTRKSIGNNDTSRVSSRISDIRNEDRSPSTPLPSINRRSYETPPSATSATSSSASGTGPSGASGRSSQLSWVEEDSSLGLAGPKAKRVIISERDQEWVDSMKEKVKLASAEKERRTRERERLDRERERKTSFGEIDKVGGTKRLFRKSLAERELLLK